MPQAREFRVSVLRPYLAGVDPLIRLIWISFQSLYSVQSTGWHLVSSLFSLYNNPILHGKQSEWRIGEMLREGEGGKSTAPTKTPAQQQPSGCFLRRISEYSEQSRCGCEFQGEKTGQLDTSSWNANRLPSIKRDVCPALLENRFQSVVILLLFHIWYSIECPTKKIQRQHLVSYFACLQFFFLCYSLLLVSSLSFFHLFHN